MSYLEYISIINHKLNLPFYKLTNEYVRDKDSSVLKQCVYILKNLKIRIF
jgi:hypothetical protein